jgi:DNA-binding GntR family transcriptional regulator
VVFSKPMITDGPRPSYMDPAPALMPSSAHCQSTTQWPCCNPMPAIEGYAPSTSTLSVDQHGASEGSCVNATSADASKYRQIATELKHRIESGTYSTGELPPATALAGEFGVAVRTIHRALHELDRAGLTASRQGRQRRVLEDPQDDAATKYEQIANDLMQGILSGALPAGGRISSEVDLASRYDVSRATVRGALEILEVKGHVVRRAGRRYVSGDSAESDIAYERIAGRLQEDIKLGRYPTGRLPGENRLAAEYDVSRPTVRQALTHLQDRGILHAVPKQGWFIAILRPTEKTGGSR